MKILVTGATGYIGGRLIPKLLEKGFDVRVFVRDPRRLQGFGWETRVEIYKGDRGNADEIETGDGKCRRCVFSCSQDSLIGMRVIRRIYFYSARWRGKSRKPRKFWKATNRRTKCPRRFEEN